MSDPAEYAIDHVSEEAGEAIFTRTGVGDPYRTGIAYPIFAALIAAYPDELGGTLPAFAARFGLIARTAGGESEDLDVREGLPVGMHLTADPNTRVPFLVTNCALCHAELIRWPGGERLVIGAGNKRLRIHAYDDALARVAARPDFDAARLAPLVAGAAEARQVAWPAEYRRPILDATVRALRERARERARFLGRTRAGLPGRIATIESFAVALEHVLGREVQGSETVGWTKIPDVIGFAHRRTVSWDAAAEGSLDALVVDADLAAGARVEWLWKHPWQGPSLSAYLRHMPRALRFPGRVDAGLAARGRASFEKACAACHGTYGEDGRATSYVERVVSTNVLGTDPARAQAVTDDFIAAAGDPKLDGGARLVRVRRTSGYVPPLLTNVWAHAPYGHAGQWPSLSVLATPPASRPVRFVVRGGAPLDLERVGVAVADPAAALGEGDFVVDTASPGLHGAGHPFLANLGADEARAVIEYLKTL
jgi:mono/diheme cytochrome c family protein